MTILKKKISYILYILFFSSFLLGDSLCVEGNGKEELFLKEGFAVNALEVEGSYDIKVIPSKSQRLEIIAESNILDLVVVKIAKNSLNISTKKSICPTKDIKINFYTPNLRKMYLEGSNELNFNISNDKLHILLDGSNTIIGQGIIDELRLTTDGSSELDLLSLDLNVINIKSEGVLDMRVFCRKKLSIEGEGMMDIQIKGSPKIESENFDGLLGMDKI